MILNNAPVNEAIVSNVGEIGEFRIRNSAKAFSILSSGLYANKIRAIIRELSCNAVDSHTAAGRADTPFDVHLPNTLEPHFSIRDYGTGLSHDQVKNIYTTYFESTKTDSNAFIGALGLGSKSPFSYTDNFTVTAIRDGRKGIYTAFINEQGVPSIALMMEEATDEPAGVEVKFGVNDRYDFDKFRHEACIVYKHFSLRPVVTGSSNFQFTNAEYESRDIIPGVHAMKGSSKSAAIMGNIAYPIELPAGSDVGGLNNLLTCSLEMHFAIGELDFQASREGLSYIPSTVEAIKRKLTELNAALSVVIAKEADAIENLWDRAVFLNNKKEHRLWTTAVQKYAADTKLVTYDVAGNYGARPRTFEFKLDDLAKDYNIRIQYISRSRGSKTITNGKPSTEYPQGHPKDANGHYITYQMWKIPVDGTSHFVINDLKTGAGSRASYHYRESECNVYQRTVWILDRADKTKDMDLKGFFAAIHEPPTARRFAASTLLKREVEKLGRNITILKLERRGGRGYRRSDEDMVWRDAGDTSAFPEKDMHGNPITYYYVPLSGFVMESAKGYTSGKSLYDDVKSLPGLYNGEIYGVRKKDIEDIRKRKNWKNFEEHITAVLNSRDTSKLLMGLVKSRLDNVDMLNFGNQNILPLIGDGSPYKKFVSVFQKVDKPSGNSYTIESLFRRFAPNANLDPTSLIVKYQKEADEVTRRYPLLSKLSTYRVDASDIAEYINLIDSKKGN
jgi:hypothetical protein